MVVFSDMPLPRAVRAPSAEELYSCGTHLASASFEVGNPELDEEISHGIDVSLRKRTGRISGQITLFVNRYDDWVFEQVW